MKNSEASLEEKSNDDPRNTNNDNLYLLSTNDETGVITIESVLDSIAPEESLDYLDGSDNSLMMKGILHFIQSCFFLLFQCLY